MTSTRFPGKVMTELNGRPLIEWQIRRLKKAKHINRLVVAITQSSADDVLHDHLEKIGVEVYRGDEYDVLGRFLKVAETSSEKNIVRLTGDCPLIMPKICDEAILKFRGGKYDYLSNTIPTTFPDGCDVEVFSKEALRKVELLNPSKEEREHVTLKLYRNGKLFKIGSLQNTVDDSKHRWTLDYPEDLPFIRNVYSLFRGSEEEFGYYDVMNAFKVGLLVPHLDRRKLRNVALRNKL